MKANSFAAAVLDGALDHSVTVYVAPYPLYIASLS